MQGDPADAVYYIWAGKISITVLSQEGKRAAVAILRAGDFFGEACLAGQLQRTATARALTAWQAAESRSVVLPARFVAFCPFVTR